MRINNLNFSASFRLDRRPERPARLEADASRQRPSLHQTHRQRGEDGIAIELILDPGAPRTKWKLMPSR